MFKSIWHKSLKFTLSIDFKTFRANILWMSFTSINVYQCVYVYMCDTVCNWINGDKNWYTNVLTIVTQLVHQHEHPLRFSIYYFFFFGSYSKWNYNHKNISVIRSILFYAENEQNKTMHNVSNRQSNIFVPVNFCFSSRVYSISCNCKVIVKVSEYFEWKINKWWVYLVMDHLTGSKTFCQKALWTNTKHLLFCDIHFSMWIFICTCLIRINMYDAHTHIHMHQINR